MLGRRSFLVFVLACVAPAALPAVASAATVSSIVRTPQALFYLERPAGGAARLMMRSPNHAPRVLLDPHVPIDRLLPSPDARRIAVRWRTSAAPFETDVRIVDTVSGALLPDVLPRSGLGPTAWSLDGTTVYYNALKADATASAVYRHRLGDTGADAPVFGFGLDPNVRFAPDDLPSLVIPDGSSYAIGVLAHGMRKELTLYSAPIAAVLSGGQIPWRPIAGIADAVVGFEVHNSTAYLLAHADGSRSEVTSLDLADDNATAATAATTIAASPATIVQIAAAADALYVRGVAGSGAQLRKLPWSTDGRPVALVDVALPIGVTLDEFAADTQLDGAVVALSGRAQSQRIEMLDAGGVLTDTGIGSAPDAVR